MSAPRLPACWADWDCRLALTWRRWRAATGRWQTPALGPSRPGTLAAMLVNQGLRLAARRVRLATRTGRAPAGSHLPPLTVVPVVVDGLGTEVVVPVVLVGGAVEVVEVVGPDGTVAVPVDDVLAGAVVAVELRRGLPYLDRGRVFAAD